MRLKDALLVLVLSFAFPDIRAQSAFPNIELENLEGKKLNLQEISKNQIIVVSLWATWCAPCKKELDAIKYVYDDWKKETSVIFYAISVDDSRTSRRVRPMVMGKGWEYEVLLDPNNRLKRELGTSAIPQTYILKDNKVLYRRLGYSSGAEEELYEKLIEFSGVDSEN